MKCYKIYKDKEYINIVSDILENESFNKIKRIKHHGLNRYDHSLRVSYHSYKIAKLLHLDYKGVARGGLLHDFFLENYKDIEIKSKIKNLINHPKIAVENAKKHFYISEKEEDIIRTHMFPIALRVPRYLESWCVVLIDDFSAIYETISIRTKQFKYAFNFLILLILNYLG